MPDTALRLSSNQNAFPGPATACTVAKPSLWLGIAADAFNLPLKEGNVLSSVKKCWYPVLLEDQVKKGLSFQLLRLLKLEDMSAPVGNVPH